jgi:L-ascorbate metabolism protein UlaG (beta-lactamase superfamily)
MRTFLHLSSIEVDPFGRERAPGIARENQFLPSNAPPAPSEDLPRHAALRSAATPTGGRDHAADVILEPAMPLSITWLGHATFLLRSPGGRKILLDPWVTGNPSSPPAAKTLGELDVILITHGHSDHTGDAVAIGRSSRAQVIAPYEVSVWLGKKGLQNVTGMNPGGTVRALGLSITMVPAVHSSSVEDNGQIVYLGMATGYVITFENGLTIYYSGDTSVFSDMRLIGEMYQPQIAFLPIGDLYTMGPEQAAKACELLGVKQVVPMHYGTFPALTGTPAKLRELVTPRGVQVLELRPGETAS